MPNSKPDRRFRDSSSNSSEELDASIYFRVGGKSAYWYVIKNNSTTPEHKILYPIFDSLPDHQKHSTCAAMGSTIYVFGGADMEYDYFYPPKLDDVYYIDTLSPKNGWKKSHSMKKPRMQAHAFTVNGKFYVMGGTFDTERRPPWAEVFHPLCEDKDNSWCALRNVTHMPDWITGHAVLDGGKRILVHAYGLETLYSYDVEDDCWGVHTQNFGKFTTTSALVDGILYYLDYERPGVILGLDISKPESFAKPIKVLGDEEEWLPKPSLDNIFPHTFLVSLGNGKLAVVWNLVNFFRKGDALVHVYCSKMKMYKEENVEGEVDLVACPISFATYYAKGFFVLDCLAVFPSEKREMQEDVSKDDDSNLTPTTRTAGATVTMTTTTRRTRTRTRRGRTTTSSRGRKAELGS